MICLGSICLWDHYNLSMDEIYIYIYIYEVFVVVICYAGM